MPTIATITPTANGVFLVRDISAESVQAQRGAADAVRIPGSRGGRLYGAAGAVLLIRCAHQYSRPLIYLTTTNEEQHHPDTWQWESPVILDVPTGHICISAGDNDIPEPLTDIALKQGPGSYTVSFAHAGRTDLQDAAARVEGETLFSTSDATRAAWRALDGMEKYLIHLTPASD